MKNRIVKALIVLTGVLFLTACANRKDENEDRGTSGTRRPDSETTEETENETESALDTECDDTCQDEIIMTRPEDEIIAKKPVIYLYPAEPMDISVTLDIEGEFICTYPSYMTGWKVRAMEDGTLYNYADGKEYAYLFWEGRLNLDYDMSEGFVVSGKDTAQFLEEKLELLGLNAKERNDFIVYWLPIMENSPYNLITFQTDVYTDHVQLNVTPAPDTMIRVFMVFEPLEKPINIEEQNLTGATRFGYTVVEWGGCQLGETD